MKTSLIADRRVLASLPTGVHLLAAIWIFISAAVFDYRTTAAGLDGRWHDVVIGAAIAATALARMVVPWFVSWLSWVNVVLGGWLAAAPTFLDFDTPTVMGNDMMVGSVVILHALISVIVARQNKRAFQRNDQIGEAG